MNQEKQKTIMIVLDGFDYEYIRSHIDGLPFFKHLKSNGLLGPLESVIPADSIPAWTTIYTGLNPAEHGILESIDYLKERNSVKTDPGIIRKKTIWDRLGNAGKKVFIFNPFMAYPAWDVNGIMITGPVFEGGEVSTNCPDLVNISEIPPIGGIVDHPADKEMEQFFEKNMKLSQRQFDAFDLYFRQDQYDFGFLGITTPDRLQHFLWRYTDPDDSTYPGGRLKDSIFEMYRLMEKNVREIMEKYGADYNVIVISDHGHGRRCEKTFYINQWLINKGFIEDKSLKKRSIEYLKNATLYFLAKHHIVEPGTRFFKKFRFAHKVKNADYIFTGTDKCVHVPRFDGCNPFGGVNVSREHFTSEEEYEEVRQQIIDGLMRVRDNDEPIMLWAKRREDIYAGEMVHNYPSIVYLMKPSYGVDRGLFGKRLFGISPMHEVVSGGHRFVGVIMGNRPDLINVGSILNVHNYVYETICEGSARMK